MSTSEVDSRNISISMRKSVENLVISSQDAIGQSISQALTFSGVISQHANQILQETTRNVSRSPSPSPRNTDASADIIENDKCSETSLAVPSNASGDTVSISSASELATVLGPPPNRADKNAGAGGRGAEGPRKKKSWYTALYPTYKSKADDFKRLFKELPDDERLIVDYSCALQKDILIHGRLYASRRFLCFHASIFGWETSLSLRWKDVTAITKEKTALVIPNAIVVCAGGERHFLTSFAGRDKAYLMLFRVWQNALIDQPMSSHEIWQWVHSCYGEELGFNSDDEGYGRAAGEELVESSMEAAGGGEPRDERPARLPPTADGEPLRVSNGEPSEYQEVGDAPPTDMSDTSDSEPDKHAQNGDDAECTADHEGRLLLQQEFPFNIDQLFTMIFTNSKFNLELLAARGTTDYVQAPWSQQGGLKCRQISYTLALTSGPIGPKEVQVTETQVMNKCSKPGVLYSIDACSENAGIPYADYFSVHVHYCLRARGRRAALNVRARLHHRKPLWPVVRGFLEKNTISGLEEFCRLLAARLAAEAGAAPPRGKRRARRHAALPQETVPGLGPVAPRVVGGVAPPRGGGSGWLLAALALLLLANAFLYWRLYHHPDNIDNIMSSVGEEQSAKWVQQLQQHADAQRGHLRAWSTLLTRTQHHLHQTEQALIKLLEIIKPSLDATPPPDQPPDDAPHAEL